MLTVATWNVLAPAYALPERYAGAAPDALDAEHRVPRVHDRIAALLARTDVLALQEVDPDLAAWLHAHAAHVVVALRRNGRDGTALVSSTHPLHDPAERITADGRRAWAEVTVEGVRIASLHVDPEWPAKRLHGAQQTAEIATALEDHDDVVLLGDLNSTWERPNGRALAHAGFRRAVTGATAATNGRTRILDVVAVRGALEPTAESTGLADVGTAYWLPTIEEPSDHVPVVARIARR